MIAALSLALSQMSDPRLQRVILRSLLYSALLFAALVALAWWGITSLGLTGIGWVDTIIDALGFLVALWLAAVLFPGVVALVMSLLLEDVAAAVEARHYRDLGPPRAQPWWEIAGVTARFALVSVTLNLLALPLYLVALALPAATLVLLPLAGAVSLVNVFVFYGLNGYLLGREYFELVAYRRLEPRAADRLRKRQRGRIFAAGVMVAALLTVPVVNFVTPVVAAAMMVHRFEFMRRRARTAA